MTKTFFFQKRFFPLFCVQFLGAFNDNVFKNALVMLITFQLAKTPNEAGLLITLAAGIFILPFFLLSAFAGQLADSHDKTMLIRKIKLAEVLIMLTAAVAFWMQDIQLLLVVLFFMGAQSAFFGPIKYGVLPEYLSETELLKGNGWFSGSTFIAILLGTLLGGWMVLSQDGIKWVSLTVIVIALAGYLMSLKVPSSDLKIEPVTLEWNLLGAIRHEVAHARQFPQAFFAVLAISWFWFLGATYLSQMPVLVKETLGANDSVVLMFLSLFSIGIGLGAWVVNQFKLDIANIRQLRWLVLPLLGISLVMLLSNALMQHSGTDTSEHGLITLSHFLSSPFHDIVLVLMGLIAVLGGIYIVPLYTLLQVQTPDGKRSRMVAANNILNAVFMVASSLWIMMLYALDWSLLTILTSIAVLNLVAAIWFMLRAKRLSIEE
ncbi:MFS transporter [Hydrogenovibrio kuenenii]|uniref:MFS transporter n=1 Tax=Hydrogenovibrio kuenenii TaxID=63658 RepID=UPI00046536D4|nr:MFS transporter [Hydrogenovibrio kuenenii]